MLAPESPRPQVPALGFEVTVCITDMRRDSRVSVDHLIAYSFKDVLTGTMQFLRKGGGPLHELD